MTFFIDENGQGMVEYALIIALISIIAIVALFFLGRSIKSTYFAPVESGLNS